MPDQSQTYQKLIRSKTNRLRRITNPQHTKVQDKKYNDNMHLTRKGEIIKIKTELAKLSAFNSKCYVCLTQTSKRGFTFHHKSYIKNDIIRSNYPLNEKGTLDYYSDLAPLIRKNPKRFLWVCNPHHQSITRICRFKKDNLKRLIQAVRMSKK